MGIEYRVFCSILHLLRDDISYRAIVDNLVQTSDSAYERHVEAVKRLSTAYLKLFSQMFALQKMLICMNLSGIV